MDKWIDDRQINYASHCCALYALRQKRRSKALSHILNLHEH